MNIQKVVSIAAAIAINVAVLAWFHAWSASVVASAAAAHAQDVAAQSAAKAAPDDGALLRARASGGGHAACLVMPYYSFAVKCDAAASG